MDDLEDGGFRQADIVFTLTITCHVEICLGWMMRRRVGIEVLYSKRESENYYLFSPFFLRLRSFPLQFISICDRITILTIPPQLFAPIYTPSYIHPPGHYERNSARSHSRSWQQPSGIASLAQTLPLNLTLLGCLIVPHRKGHQSPNIRLSVLERALLCSYW